MRRKMLFLLLLGVLILLAACGGGNTNCTWDHLKTAPFSDCPSYNKEFHVELTQTARIQSLGGGVYQILAEIGGSCQDTNPADDACRWETITVDGEKEDICLCTDICGRTYRDEDGSQCSSSTNTANGNGDNNGNNNNQDACSRQDDCSLVTCSRTCSDGKTHYGTAYVCTSQCKHLETSCSACDTLQP